MNEPKQDWNLDDHELESEFADVIPLIRERDKSVPAVPKSLRHKVTAMAASDQAEALQNHWLLGQGPKVVMVTLILFVGAMMVLFF